jgi:glycosyltransferase involved in cell wall biosynthesis
LPEQVFFSVIIPTFNRSYCILDAINSVLNQTFGDFEVIIIDDGSTDSSFDIINQIDDSRLIVNKNITSEGASASRNKAAGLATGKYLAFLDSDDFWEVNFLYEFKKSIERHPQIQCFYCWLNTEKGIYSKWYLEGEIYSKALEQGELSSTITLVISKMAFLMVKGFDISFSNCDDDDLCFRLAKEFEFKLIPKPLAKSRAIDTNAMTKNGISLAKGKEKLLEKYKHDIFTLLGKKVLSRKYYQLSNNYLLAGDISKFKLNLMAALKLRFENQPGFFHVVAFKLIFLYKYRYVRKSL